MSNRGMTDEDAALLAALVRRLEAELNNCGSAERLARYLFDTALTWRPRATSDASIDTIIAFSFGLRAEDASDPTAVAGPVNELIAEVVEELARRHPDASIFAQWEIARVLNKRGNAHPVSIERVVTPRGEVYLSTRGVVEQAIARRGGNANALGQTLVAAHHDHAWRCVDVCRRLGIDAFVAADLDLPKIYDQLSVQNFTHSPDVWTIYDLAIRIGDERQRRIGG